MADHQGDSDLERRDFIGAMAQHRRLLRRSVRGLSDEQIRLRPTVSTLCLGGILTHVTGVEQSWVRFITEGTSAMRGGDASTFASHADTFALADDDTAAVLLERYKATALATDALIMALPSLNVAHPLPEAPWFEHGASWSARRVLVHIVAETAQHAGHADIIREAIDGSKSMG
jgi:uncharacterized damage-inducible protein DinB